MRPFLAFFLSLLMLVGGLMPQNDVEELGKLPQLVQHFQYHRSPQGGGLSFSQFLSKHYGGSTNAVFNCPPSPEHDKLPLRGAHQCPNLEYVVPAARQLAALSYHAWPALAYRLAASPRYTFAFRAALLEPPRA
ncbi:hypothetical protein H8B13_02915 [Hymenobacter sp. BT188]|uniref:hypothetical protein n=1 Tax=Hymenobacter sp. BT188 TaxID=2763504 RepID=UPI0016518A9E|nr:hypothetical protein [Hymenobacter sp. BT188]MBC6605760.1 hypothetical protein [Hymenobacter sp. BT188]